jgi:hypothetical protein
MARLFLILLLISAVSCQVPMRPDAAGFLRDNDFIPLGSKIEFWIYTDADGQPDKEDGWQKSNIHIRRLPRPMTGAEARRWAEGVGQRDTGMRWTHYYVLVTHPGWQQQTFRSAVTAYTPSARLHSPR